MVDERYTLDANTSAEELAATIVHEATHARLEALGFRYTPERRARIEAVCFRRARAFARRLPEATELIEAIEPRGAG